MKQIHVSADMNVNPKQKLNIKKTVFSTIEHRPKFVT